MFKYALALATLSFSLLLPACGNNSSPTTQAASGGGDKIKVGLLVTGSTSDGGWNQLAGDAIHRLEKQNPDLQVAIREQVTPDAAPDAVRQFDAQGYALIIGHGFEYQAVANDIMNSPNPVKSKIVVSGGDMDSSKFQSLDYGLWGASYQLGIVAARVSKTGKLGFIGGEAVPTLLAMQKGFEAGAKSVNPNATVTAQYTGWDDPSKAKKQAEAFMEQNVDVIMQDVDAASRGVFEAVKEHNDAGKSTVYTFGSNSNQNDNPVCSDFTLGSAVINLDLAFSQSIDQVRKGTFKPGRQSEDLPSGVSTAVLNPKCIGKQIDTETQRLVDEATKQITANKITIPPTK